MVRLILDLEPRTHLTVDHVKELDLLRVSDRAKQRRLNTAHKIFYEQAPEYLQEDFEKGWKQATAAYQEQTVEFYCAKCQGK